MRLRLFPSLAAYQPQWLRGDLIAGLTVWAVLVPEALAYASIAGVSPVVGLYAAPGALILYAALGSSRHLIVGPMSATAALSASAIAQFTTQGSDPFLTLTVSLAITTGILGVVAGLSRLGFVANFISEPVLKGFIVGMALTIIAGQLPKLLGIEDVSGDFFEKMAGIIRELGSTQLLALAVGLLTLGIVLGLKEYAPVLPGSLFAVGISIVAVRLFGLDEQGLEIVGPIDAGLPTIGLPSTDPADYLQLVPSAVGILLVGFAEGLGAARTYAARDHYEIDANRELLGLGTANLASGLSSGMVVNGSLSKTAVNGGAGAKTQVSGLVVAAMTIVTLLFLTSLFEGLPEATLAGVVIAAVIELVDFRSLRRLYRLSSEPIARVSGLTARPDFVAAVAALLGVLLFGTLPGLFLGIGIAFALLLYRASAPRVATLGLVPGTHGQYGDIARHPENRVVSGVIVLRPESGLFFANADHVSRMILEAASRPGTRAIVLDLETVPSVDVTAVRRLVEVDEQVTAAGVDLLLARDLGQVRDLIRREVDDRALGNVYPTVRAAVDAAAGDLDSDGIPDSSADGDDADQPPEDVP